MSVSVFGGAVSFKRVKPVYSTVDSWVSIASLGMSRYGAGAFIYGNRLYVVGGQTVKGITSTVEVIDLATGDRSYASFMPDARAHFAHAFVNDKFYVIGGVDRGGVPRKEIFEFDPANNQWSVKSATLPKGIAYSASAVLNNKIYITGGLDDQGNILADTYVYDPADDAVVQKASMNTARENHACAPLNDKIYCFAGDDGQNPLQTIEAYDPSRDEWTQLQTVVPEPVTGIRAVPITMNGKQYILILGG